MKLKCLFVLALISSACATRHVKVLDASWVSMKHTAPPENVQKLQKAGFVEEEYCMDSWSGEYGLMDEAVKRAEKNHNLDYIRNASFNKTLGKPCVTVSGEGYREIQ